ncbi:hypothetical protein [Streptomyces sp. NPDC048825]|uniref:hypothetical protein n=1 Tax=Streptomyces sp. NPDC048825 TaxID=3365592 RepID=UPI00371065F4
MIATWATSADCGTHFETLTADGQVRVDGRPPLGEPFSQGEDDPDCTPICWCTRTAKQFCLACACCAACGQCRGPHTWPPTLA